MVHIVWTRGEILNNAGTFEMVWVYILLLYLHEVFLSLKALVWRRWVLAMVPVFVWWSIFSGLEVEFNNFFVLEIQGWTTFCPCF